jgi:hypothetical protein
MNVEMLIGHISISNFFLFKDFICGRDLLLAFCHPIRECYYNTVLLLFMEKYLEKYKLVVLGKESFLSWWCCVVMFIFSQPV